MTPDSPSVDAKPMSWAAALGRMAISLVLALGLYAATTAFLIGPYIHKASDAGRVVGVYQGYDRIAGESKGGRELVLFWGSSMIREGIDCDLLESIDPRLASYNLSVSGDIPYRRIVELPRARKLRPKCVVIGVSYPEVFETRTPFEDQIAALPSSAYSEMPAAAHALLNRKFRQIAERSAWERFWWKRKFLFSAVCWKLGVPDRSNPAPDGYVDDLKTPYLYRKSVQPAELQRFLAQRGNFYPPYTSGGEASPGQSVSARSLALLISELVEQKTEVVVVNMPLHPLLNAAVPAERRLALRNYLNSFASLKVTVLDYQDQLGPERFVDLVHLNASGRDFFTRQMADHLSSHAITMVNRRTEHEL